VSALQSLRVDELVDAVAAETPAPGGGAVAAIVTSLAAALTAMAGRYAVAKAEQPAEMLALVARADELRRSAAPLADLDGELYRKLLAALRMPREPDREARAQAIAAASERAAEPPMLVVQAAAEVSELAARLAESGNRNLRGDAATAAMLASAAADSAAILVAENLARMPDDQRLGRAAALTARARAAAARVRSLFPLVNSDPNHRPRSNP
jgi:formiminotetrahydrofolate cyclodeaminase